MGRLEGSKTIDRYNYEVKDALNDFISACRALVDDGKGGQVPLIIRDLAELDPDKRVRYYLDALKILAPKDINVLNSATSQTIEQRLIELSGIIEDADCDDDENDQENEAENEEI